MKGTLLTEPAVKVGLYAEVEHTFSQDAVNVFAGLCGDNNPLHCDPAFAKNTMFGGTIVHGIFVSSLFSTLFGRSVAGSIYVSQNLAFKRPVHVGVPVTAKMVIEAIEDKRKGQLLICSTTCSLADGTVAVAGEARVLLPFK
jgi:3-hydroxybutyryl-CoA dehydratase